MLFFQSTQILLTRVPETTSAEFEQAVGAASEAFKTRRNTPVITRQRFVLGYVLSQYPNCKTHVPTMANEYSRIWVLRITPSLCLMVHSFPRPQCHYLTTLLSQQNPCTKL